MDFHVYFHTEGSQDILRKLCELQDLVENLHEAVLSKGELIMASLTQVLEAVSAETTKLDSLQALIEGLRQQLSDALSGVTLPPSVQAQVDQVFDVVNVNLAKIDAALAENVPA